ncbi:hypothetical protein [Leptospira stimsonii]|uniref:Lipoprotein n=1 Tax=Leptospira stimsonii TaxID=2202203 RepID=A0ABY2N337_9LEPT|nr:hypothetical protein [Leptospira stimsonii]TGK20251.1 hypothetical protein EHO98_09930 [Leptospira stimsonii]TGM14894.1 hypothetical protein EHQ90_10455 [Leptospira stimsonii]
MKKIKILLLINLAFYGCLQFPNTPMRKVSIESGMPSLNQNDICYEFVLQTMNGKTLEANLKNYGGKAYVDFFNKVKNGIQNYLNENSRINHCRNELKSKSKIFISLEINSYADCSKKINAEDFNGCEIWGTLTGVTLGVIPFWGTSTSEIRFEIVDEKNQMYKYSYQPSFFSITHILLLPLTWINWIRNMPETPFKNSVELFLIDSGLKESPK